MIDLVRGDEDLAREINAEHGLVETYKHNTIRHAICCGELPRAMNSPVPTHRSDPYETLAEGHDAAPCATGLAEEILSLPISRPSPAGRSSGSAMPFASARSTYATRGPPCDLRHARKPNHYCSVGLDGGEGSLDFLRPRIEQEAAAG